LERLRDGKYCRGAHCCLVHHHSVPNGCRRPVFRPEKSHGCKLGAMGNVAASLAQSKHVGGCKMAHLGLGRDELRWTGGVQGVGGGPGVFVGIDVVVDDDSRV
jgi:hypothetical protein